MWMRVEGVAGTIAFMEHDDEISWTPDDTWARAAVRRMLRMALLALAAELQLQAREVGR